MSITRKEWGIAIQALDDVKHLEDRKIGSWATAIKIFIDDASMDGFP